MREIVRSLNPYPVLVLGSVVLLGVLEFVALQRSQLMTRGQQRH